MGIYKEETGRREIIAAEQGDMAQFKIANKCYNDTIGTSMAYAEAAKLYQKAAEQGHQKARLMVLQFQK